MKDAEQRQLKRSQKKLESALDVLKTQTKPDAPVASGKAKELCTKDEYEFYLTCQPNNLRKLGAGLLRGKAQRARKLRDKYRDLSRRQKRRARSNERTVLKAQLFAEILHRIEASLIAQAQMA